MTAIDDRDLTKEAPHSPNDRFGGFAILARTVDKCRANKAGKIGDFHFDCPLDNQLFGFKGIDAKQFEKAVSSARNYEDVATWLQSAGKKKTQEEIEAWSDKASSTKLKDVPTMKEPDHRKEAQKSCEKLGLDFETVKLFEWLDADDAEMNESHMATAGR